MRRRGIEAGSILIKQDPMLLPSSINYEITLLRLA